MAKTYDRDPVTIIVVKDMLGLRKTIEADRRECPDMIFTYDQAQSLWDTLRGSGYPIAGQNLGLYGEALNAKGNYPEMLAAFQEVQAISQRTGEPYTRKAQWSADQLKAFKPTLIRLEVGRFYQPQLCAYMVAPPSPSRAGGKARVIPAIIRVDVASPEGKAIAARHEGPKTVRLNRR